MNKKTKIIAIIGIITILLTIGISYAIYVASVRQINPNEVLSKCIGITKSSETNALSLQNAMPMIDEEGLELTPYTLTVTNTCNSSTNFIITMDMLNIEGKTSSDYIPTSVVKVSVNGIISIIGEGEEYTRIDNSYESRIIYYGIFNGLETKKFNIRMWLDERATVEEAGNKYLNTIVSVYSGQVPMPLGNEYILAMWKDMGISIDEETIPDFSKIADTEEGVFTAEDDYGTSYYVRGAANYNFVKFGKDSNENDFWWRIIRINGDGTIRMIYQGTSYNASGDASSINETQYTFSKNAQYNDNMYVGYKYTNGQRQGLSENSNAKEILENWYEINLKDNYGKYIVEQIFCGDRTSLTNPVAWPIITSSGGVGTAVSFYGSFTRLFSTRTPIFYCPEELDKYTTINSNKGNKSLLYPIGLITIDEVAYAGGVSALENLGYYLSTNSLFWTMTPGEFNSTGNACNWVVYPNGAFYTNGVNNVRVLRPVINISSNTPLSGNGTTTNPFYIP